MMKSESYQAAPVWRRFAAIGYDSLLVIALAFLAGFINLGIQMAIFGEPELRKMTIRFIVAIPALLLAGPGVFWVWFDRKNRSWQDIASSSVTILEPEAKTN